MQPSDSVSNVSHTLSGVMELREDAPLKGGESGTGCGGCSGAGVGGPRLILVSFAALSAAVTIALLTQIYYGDYQLVPHGVVASDAAECSRAGTDALKAGGNALDAAVAAALCLAVVAPHRTSLDASGSLLFWEYRKSRSMQPMLVEWGAGGANGASADERDGARPPRLVHALASLHAARGHLPWTRLLQPAINLARDGYVVSEGLSQMASQGARGDGQVSLAGEMRKAPLLARYLHELQMNSSAELSAEWSKEHAPYATPPAPAPRVAVTAGWAAWSGGAGTDAALSALRRAIEPLSPLHVQNVSTLTDSVVRELQAAATSGTWPASANDSVTTGLAVVDAQDNYVALVTGMSTWFGSGAVTGAGWTHDEPAAPLDLAPAIITDTHVCGTRYVIGAESSGALAQAAAALLATGVPSAVEEPRVLVHAPSHPATPPNAATPHPAVNIVQQRGDALLSHADSRGGGFASRF